MPLQGFNFDLCQAAAGLSGLGVLEYIAVDEIPSDAYDPALNAAYNQQASLGVSWLKLPYIAESGQWSEDQQQADQGNYYKINISIFLPGDSLAIRAELDAMKQHVFLTRLRRNKMTLLVGKPEQPLICSSQYDSGTSPADRRGHRISFTGLSLKKSPGYVPVF